MSRVAGTVVAVVVASCGVRAGAQEMIEIPTPPRDPCCQLAAPPPPPPRVPSSVYVAIDGGAGYRRAFDTDLAGAVFTLGIGGQTATWSLSGRLRLDAGMVEGGLPYQHLSIGPTMLGRVSPRVALGGGLSFGVFMYERVSSARSYDPVVWAPSIGAEGDILVDVVRTQRGGALFAHGRVGLDYIDSSGPDANGISIALGLGLGYRY